MRNADTTGFDFMDIINRIDSLTSAAAVAVKLAKDGGDTLDVILGLKESLQEFRSEALEAKAQTLELREQVVELREQLSQVRGHQQDKELYHLQQFDTGSLVYELKEEAGEGNVKHFLCVPCFDDGVLPRYYGHFQEAP